jgi:hypothetical protein
MITASPRTNNISIFRVAVCASRPDVSKTYCSSSAVDTHPDAMLAAVLRNVYDRYLLLDVREHEVAVRVECLR